MNTPRRSRRINRLRVALVATLLAILSSVAPSLSAQTSPGAVVATQFFGSITGEEAGYQLSPDAMLHTPEGDYVGRAGLVTFGDDLAASFAYLDFSMQAAVQAGEMVIVSLTITGVNTGNYHGIAANCAGVTIPAVAVLRVSERQHITGALAETVVVEQWIDYDRVLIASQISAVNLMDPGDRPGCAGQVVTLDQEANDELPPTSPLPPVFDDPY
ncbi:MAG: ester cyclase [Chloroflexota bacterium]|nr:ester cyclase [Chloroflexota bacterium]